MTPLEWGTDYWDEVLQEASEAYARRIVAREPKVKLYCRIPGDAWCEVVSEPHEQTLVD